MADGRYPKLLFKSDDDVFDIIDKLITETKEANKDLGKDFNIAKSINSQISFFACRNIFLDKQSQKDISRYLYCTKMKTPPYPGSFSEQPLRWVRKSFIIKNAIESITDNSSIVEPNG